jgi:cysteinyl-tRNA synthetase
MLQIVDNGHAYAAGGDVFFDVASLPGYGALSGRSQVITHAAVF